MTSPSRLVPAPGIALVVLAAAGVLSAMAPWASGLPTYARLDGDYLQGNLTWNNGVGGIAWHPDAPTEDPGGPSGGHVHEVVSWGGHAARFLSNVDNVLLARETFTSDPLLRGLYLNASRDIIFELFFTSSDCSPIAMPEFIIEVNAGTGWLGGAEGDYVKPGDPVGFCGFRFGLHPEQDFLPEGSRITVTIYHFAAPESTGATEVRYGLRWHHQTAVLLPVFPPDEAIFRRPDLAPDLGGDEDGTEASPRWAPAAPLAGVLPFRWRRSASRLLTGLLLAGALSGCTGSPDRAAGAIDDVGPSDGTPRGGGRVNTSYVEGGALGVSQAGRGTVAGTVLDEMGYPAASARVSLLGTSNFTDTNRYGRFVFSELRPGWYDVLVQKTRYRSLETRVEVVPDLVARLTLTLDPSAPIPLDRRPHQHMDPWAGKPYFDLVVDEPLPFASGSICNRASGRLDQGIYSCRKQFLLPTTEPQKMLIFPGTYDVEITLKWPTIEEDAHNTFDLAGVGIGHNLLSVQDRRDYPRYMVPRERGASAHFRTAWEITDDGHSPRTGWNLWVYIPHTMVNARSFDTTFLVSIRLHKGLIPFEPAHPDYWKGGDVFSLPLAWSFNNNPVNTCTSGSATATQYSCKSWFPKAGYLVTGEARWTEVVLNQTARPAQGDVAWLLEYKTAGTGTGSLQATPTRQSFPNTYYAFEIGPGHPDSFYARGSAWTFSISGQQPGPSPGGPAITFGIEVLLHRDPMPT